MGEGGVVVTRRQDCTCNCTSSFCVVQERGVARSELDHDIKLAENSGTRVGKQGPFHRGSP